MRAVLFTVLLLILGFEVTSQQYHYSIRNYRAMDGLPQSQVKSVLEDKNGYLWIGTEGGGLARFDGHTFRVFTTLDGLQSNVVSFLNIDSHDNIWVMHPRGITRFDGSSFKKFEQPGDPQNTSRLRRLFELGDTLFFMSAPGYLGKIHQDSVYYWSKPIFEPKQGQRVPIINFAREGPNNELIFCVDFSKFICRRGTETFVVPFEESYQAIKSTFVYNGKIMMLTDKGYRSLDLDKRAIVVEEGLPIKNFVVYYDSLQKVFWTIHGNDFLKERIVGDKVKTDTVLRDTEITNVLTDSEGNTWFGSNGSGLYKYFVQDFDRCGSDKMTNVMAIHRDSENSTWVGTMTKGVYRIKKGKVKVFHSEAEPSKNSVFSIEESPDGTLYFGGSYGLGRYNREKDEIDWETFPVGERFRAGIINVKLTPGGGMWMAMTGRGLVYRDSSRTKRFSMDDGMKSNVVMAMHYSPYYKRFFYGDEFGLASIENDKITHLKTGIMNATVIAIHPYRDSLLLLSTGGEGVFVYNPGTGSRKVLTTADGLASDFVYFTAPDEADNLWVGSEKGITKVRIDSNLQLVEHLHYDYENGLIGVETNQNAFCFFDDTKVFGLIDGLYQFNDPPARDNPFPLHLTDVQLFYGETPTDEYAESHSGFFHIPQGLSLPPDKNHITFKFNRVDKRSRKATKFKYLLQGFDKKWSKPSSSSEVTYSNLPPGEYTFLVMSTDPEGGWSGLPLQYEFNILRPFYAKIEFIIAAVIFFAAFVALVMYIRVRQRFRHVVMLQKIRIKEQETVRKDIARDFHDEMGNQLSRIINYVSLLKLNGHNGSSHNHDLYSKVEESAKYLYTGTRDFIWSIDPGNDELSKLFIHIRDFGEKLFEEKGIKFRAINNVREAIRLPYGFSREANLIFKEAMTNAFKYSRAENVTFSLKPVQDGFELCLEDDGIGFDPDMVGARDGGLKNIRERAERIDVDLKIEGHLSKGTKVYIQFSKTKKMHYGLTF
jgi:ligand-binding sensor domain-containing protein/signal transduction histidine kinase